MKILKRTLFALVILVVVLAIGISLYASHPYEPEQAMIDAIDQLDTTMVTVHEDFDEIAFTVENPKKQIVFIPGGLVEPDSYDYLAFRLALAGYNVTIYKPFYNLAIFTPNYAKRFLSDQLENIVIGHSLGGVVASMMSSGNPKVSGVILLGSYPIKDLTDKPVMILTAEFDIAMDQEKFNESLQYLNSQAIIDDIAGGNHAQFGWYGPQKGDGTATIDTLTQQNIVVAKIVEFIDSI